MYQEYRMSESVATGKSRKKGEVRKSAAKDKQEIIRLVDSGMSVTAAARRLGISRQLVYAYKRDDARFAAALSKAQDTTTKVYTPEEVPDFPQFCEQYLGFRLFAHQLQWVDLLQGRTPRNIHPSMTFEPGDRDMLIVNTPPGHAKSSTITVAYVTWLIVKNPSTRVVIVSKTQRLATQFLLTIKSYLTHPNYARLQNDFAPPGGFDADAASWKQDLIYVSSAVRDVQEKDPTVQAIGIGGQLYGARADLIILDDCVDNQNAKDFDKQINWIQTEVASRLPDGGKILVVGTRLAPQDLYVELRNPQRYNSDEDDESPWTYFAQPAVLEFHENPSDWVTLWPKCDKASGRAVLPDAEGLFDKWTGEVLSRRRRRMPPSSWARVYQQEQVSEETVFRIEDINACTFGYSPGLLPDTTNYPNKDNGRVGGMNGLTVIAGLDPASVGHTAAVCVGLDLSSGVRYVLDVHNEAGMKPDAMRSLIMSWQDKYKVDEWRIERNAFQGFLTQDTQIRQYIASRGGTLVEHTTGRNKHDELLGVMSMGSLFESGMIHLPRPQTEGVKALIEQLSYWSADLPKSAKTDCVMALWFTHIRASELVQSLGASRAFSDANAMFYTRMDFASREIVPVMDSMSAGSLHKRFWG